MIIKFCFNHEIHRSTSPPADFAALRPLLQNMFRISLSDNFFLYYVDSSNNKVTISSQEEYIALLNSTEFASVKLYVPENELSLEAFSEIEDSGIIPNIEQEEPEDGFEILEDDDTQKNLEEEAKKSDQMVVLDKSEITFEVDDDVEAKSEVWSSVESRVYDSIKSSHDIGLEQEEKLREIVKETVKQELPYLMARVEEKVTGTNREYTDQATQCSFKCQCKHRETTEHAQTVVHHGQRKEEKSNVFNQLKGFGKALKAHIKELPEVAKDLLDDVSQMIEGDPNIIFAGGRYPQSVVEKTYKLKEIFQEESVQELAEFTKKLPRSVNVDQIVELYISTQRVKSEVSRYM